MKIKRYPKISMTVCPVCDSVFKITKYDYRRNRVSKIRTIYEENNRLYCTCPVCGKNGIVVGSSSTEYLSAIEGYFEYAAAKINKLPKDNNSKAVANTFNNLYEQIENLMGEGRTGNEDN